MSSACHVNLHRMSTRTRDRGGRPEQVLRRRAGSPRSELRGGQGGGLLPARPHGAGKTTIVEILEGYRTRSAGEARVLGIDPATGSRALREQVGIVLQQCGVQNDLSVAELVEMYGRYHVTRRPVDEVIE